MGNTSKTLALFFSVWLALNLPEIAAKSMSSVHVRLVGNSMPNAGRVEIGYKGQWKSVCDFYWNINAAHVVCRMLGYGQGAAAAIRGMISSDDAWLSKISCSEPKTAITLEECSITNRKSKPCAHDRRAGVVCKSALDPNITVRLADGKTENQGRVEVRYYGIWGTVCVGEWDLADADVACRMLNYSKASWTGIAKVQGSGPILLDNLRCNGKEKSLDECRQKPWGNHFCTHAHDVHVTCNNEKHQPSISVQVRLIEGQKHFGRVEVNFNGTWIPVCDDTWDISDAHVVCRMLGYKAARISIKKVQVGYRGPWLSGLGCNGDERSISQCYHHWWTGKNPKCSHGAAVLCKVNDDKDPKVAVRLMNGSTPNQGRVEVRYYGVWGTVCRWGGWGMRDAHVVCRMLNYTKASWARAAKVQGNGPVLLHNLKCNGNEKSLENCPDIRWGGDNCNSRFQGGVKCEMATQEESSISVRLVRTKQRNVGAVEVKYNGTWRPVCDESWSILEAQVVCTMLGYKGALAAIKQYDGGNDGFWMNSVVCSGKEVSLGECSHSGWSNTKCSKNFYAAVMCTMDTGPPPLQVRLEGASSNSGRVAVRYGNVWGTICNRGLDINDAQVICRMLGYPGARKVYPVNSLVSSADVVWLSDLQCNGTETSITNCRHPGWGQKRCNDNDGGVVCSPADAPRFQISNIKGISDSKAVISFDKPQRNEAQMKSVYQVSVEKRNIEQRFKSYEQPAPFVYNDLNVTMATQMGNDSYITAEIPGPLSNLTIGDGQYYHGYYNAPLEPRSMYRVHVRIVTMAMDGTRVFGDSAYVAFTTKSLSNGIAKPFKHLNNADLIGTVIVLSVFILLSVIISSVLWSLKRKKEKNKRDLGTEMAELTKGPYKIFDGNNAL